jgi:hypothetical protein
VRTALFLTLLTLTAVAQAGEAQPLGADTRQPLPLNAGEANFLRAEMRDFLKGLQQIVEGVSRNDMKRVALTARSLGMAGTHHVPQSLRMKLPADFKVQGHAVHTAFDDIARDAESLGDPMQTQKQVGQILQQCVSCHNQFRIQQSRR